jgi:hypothetical protein
MQLMGGLPGFGLAPIAQALEAPPAGGGPLAAINSLEVRLGPLGTWRVTVRGEWSDNGGGVCANVSNVSFAVRPLQLLGVPLDALPELSAPIPGPLQARTQWCTTYLDDDVRVARVSTGSLLLFRRPAAAL